MAMPSLYGLGIYVLSSTEALVRMPAAGLDVGWLGPGAAPSSLAVYCFLQMGLEDGDTIDVMQQQTGGC
jgi:hypothetical protein